MEDNYIEVLEFTVDGQSYGMDVVMVKEILEYMPVTFVPNVHPNVEGVFMPRDKTITAIDLMRSLNVGTSGQNGSFVVTQFGEFDVALHVQAVRGIRRMMRSDIIDVCAGGVLNKDGYATGVVKVENRLVILLNYDRIIREVDMESMREYLDD